MTAAELAELERERLERIERAALNLVAYYDDPGGFCLVGGALEAHRRALVKELRHALEDRASSSPSPGGEPPTGG